MPPPAGRVVLATRRAATGTRTLRATPAVRRAPEVRLGLQPVMEAVNSAKHLLAGALSAVVSRTCCAPLERVKMQMMFQQRALPPLAVAWGILRQEGLPGFWRGNGINILRTAPYKAVNFFSFDSYRRAFENVLGHEPGNQAKIFAGALAGVTATLLCFPLDVLRTRIMSAPPRSAVLEAQPLAVLGHLARSEGVPALYVGVLPALIAMAPSGAVYYSLYDALKTRHLSAVARRTGVQATRLEARHSMLFGAMSGAAAETCVYPLEVVRRRMQTMAANQGAGCGRGGLSMFQRAALDIWRRERLRGFYSGMLPNTIQVLPSAALSYWAFETFKATLQVE